MSLALLLKSFMIAASWSSAWDSIGEEINGAHSGLARIGTKVVEQSSSV